MTRAEVLERAAQIVNGDRDEQYGKPEDNFKTIAAFWSEYLFGDTDSVGPEDVAIMMMFMKLARLKASNYQSVDSWVDIAGYTACGAEIATRGVSHA